MEKLLHRAMCGGFFRLRTLSVKAFGFASSPKGGAKGNPRFSSICSL